ncbi:MAG: PAS/PAC sensor-containing diguanylate [Planctomycetota bacterium]|nr:MAG: PAS/PAC sensor-containing diguanylate [Planctomycetota bacterium]
MSIGPVSHEFRAHDLADRLVRALAFAAESFLTAERWDRSLGDVVAEFGSALGVCRGAVYGTEGSSTAQAPCFEWRADPEMPIPGPRSFPRWDGALRQGGAIFGPVSDLPPEERDPLLAEGVQSVLAVAIHAGTEWWGMFLFEDIRERDWSRSELQVVMAASHTLGAALIQDRARHDLRDAEARYRTILQSQTELICRFHADGRLTFANEAFRRRTGFDSEKDGRSLWNVLSDGASGAMRSALNDLQAGGLPVTIENSITLSDGSEFWLQWSVQAIPHDAGGALEYQAVGTDVTERRRLTAQLEREAHFDELTGIANRRMFAYRSRRALGLARREGWTSALLLIDLDRFKHINDSLGHAAGDEALIQVAARLQDEVREADVLARMGGDEFAILFAHVDKEVVAGLGLRLMEAIELPLHVQGHAVQLSASIGIAVFPRDHSDLEDLLRHADTAMYRAKAEGGGVRFYNESLDSEAQEHFVLESDLREALEKGQLEVHFQPVTRLDSQKVIGAEALCRWRHPTRGMVPPSKFLAAVEGSALAAVLDQWVISSAVQQLAAWRKSGWPGWISVNLSPRTIQAKGLSLMLQLLLKESGVDPGGLVIELTEHVLADPGRVLPIFHKLRELGVRLAVDDFGAGHASFGYLEQFPIDILKVDQQFVKRPWRRMGSDHLVKTIAELGHSLGIQVLAEGIETPEQLAWIRDAGCDLGQGYLFGKPVPGSDFSRAWLPNRPLGRVLTSEA